MQELERALTLWRFALVVPTDLVTVQQNSRRLETVVVALDLSAN